MWSKTYTRARVGRGLTPSRLPALHPALSSPRTRLFKAELSLGRDTAERWTERTNITAAARHAGVPFCLPVSSTTPPAHPHFFAVRLRQKSIQNAGGTRGAAEIHQVRQMKKKKVSPNVKEQCERTCKQCPWK